MRDAASCLREIDHFCTDERFLDICRKRSIGVIFVYRQKSLAIRLAYASVTIQIFVKQHLRYKYIILALQMW